MKRRLAAILTADLVGYSRLVNADEAGTIADFKALREDCIEPLIAAHQGRMVKAMGDGFLVEFGSAVDAISAAIAWQQAMRGDRRRADHRFRIGINLGDIIVQDDDIHGEGVNIAARLEGIAEPGGICIADMVYQNVVGRVDAEFDDLGRVKLKNMENEIQVWRWIPPADPWKGTPVQEGEAPVPMDSQGIAVLPFDDISNDPEQSYFCDGMSEDLITELSHVPGLTVIARHSSFVYRGLSADARQIGTELGVRHLVEGSVRRAGNRVRINAQLIDARSGAHLWAQKYDRDIDDIFAVQDDVVQQIAGALSQRLQRPDIAPVQSVRSRNLSAYEHVMQGRQNILSASRHADAKKALEKAISEDPKLSDAYAWLAVYYYTDWFLYHHEPDREAMVAAFAAADNAMETGPDNSLAHMALGMVSLYAGRRAIALQSLRRALDLNPNEADAYCLLQDAYTFDGEPTKGVESVRMAMRLNPHYPEWYIWHLGFALYCARDYSGAVNELSRLKEIAEPFRILAAAHARLGQMDEARGVAAKFMRAFPDFSSVAWGRTQPFRHREDLDHVLEGYRLAGLPD